MQCKVDGCDRPIRYKAACLCQLHYFRVRRGGTTDLTRKSAKPRIEDDRGYQFLHAPKHPLCRKGQIYVAEHRIVLFEAIGPDPMSCELCGCGLTWDSCNVDHIDENPRNNERANLRPTCRRCNTWRNMPPAAVRMKNATVLSFAGETKTAHEWSKDSRVAVSATAIRHRKLSGMTDEQALFSEKTTHNGRPPKPYKPKTNFKHERSNAIAITIRGVTKTAAEWAREPSVSVGAAGMAWRIKAGWTHERAVYQPSKLRELKKETA